MTLDKELINKTYKTLELLGDGLFKCGLFGGWISVKKEGPKYDIMWTTSKDSHDPFQGPAYAAYITDGGYSLVMQSVLSMHLVRDENKQEEVITILVDKINKAHKHTNRWWA